MKRQCIRYLRDLKVCLWKGQSKLQNADVVRCHRKAGGSRRHVCLKSPINPPQQPCRQVTALSVQKLALTFPFWMPSAAMPETCLASLKWRSKARLPKYDAPPGAGASIEVTPLTMTGKQTRLHYCTR